MSTTFKIDGAFVQADPLRVSWQPKVTPHGRHTGGKTQSKFNDAILSFNPLTSAQYDEWASVCDDGAFHTVFMPGRCDAVYATTYGIYSGDDFTGKYRLHFLGSRHSLGVHIYDTEILLYGCMLPDCPIPIELGGCT